MSEFTIEQGIEIPKRTRIGKSKYPWSDMEVGDSFLVPCESVPSAQKMRVNLTASGRRYFEQHDPAYKVTVQTTEGGCRAWLEAKPVV